MKLNELAELNKKLRVNLINLLHSIQTGHPGGSLSSTEILTMLYFNIMDCEKDRFILSKGHAAPMLYQVLAEKGYFPQEELKTLRQLGAMLQGHPCAKTTPGIDLSTGPLGLGISAGVGMAKGFKMKGMDNRVYVLMGDGELQEGVVWEAAMSASKYKLDNLMVIVDYNGVQLDGTVENIMPMGDLAAKWKAFGFNVLETEGHHIEKLEKTLNKAKEIKEVPTAVLASTVKGKGISFMEGKNIWHGKPISDVEHKDALKELGVN